LRIEWAVICRYVETLPTGTTMVGVGMDGVEPLALPAEIRLNVAIAFALSYYEVQGTHETLTFRVRAPDMDEIHTARVEFQIGGTVTPGFPEGSEGHRILPVAVAFRAATPGSYTLEFRLDDDEPTTLSLFVPALSG
jgi:hypothetical protein